MKTISINGEEYDLDSLSVAAKDHIASMRYCEVEVKKAQLQVAALTTAQNAYAQALIKEIGRDNDSQAEIEIPDSISFE